MSTAAKRRPIERVPGGLTYAQIGLELGVTPEAARLAVKHATAKFCARLEAVLEREGLTAADLLTDGEYNDGLLPFLLARRVD